MIVVGADQSFLFDVARDGQLGARRGLPLAPGTAVTNKRLVADGTVVGIDRGSQSIEAWTAADQCQIGTVGASRLFSVHYESGQTAWVDEDSILSLAVPQADGTYRSSSSDVPVLDPPPESLGWTRGGRMVVVAEQAGGVWGTYKVVGN